MGNFAMIDLSRKSRFSAAIAVALLTATASAQTTTTPTPTPTSGPCPATTPPVVQSFTVERSLTAAQTLATGQPTVPANVLAGISTTPPALQVRESITYDPANQLLTLNEFSVQPGAALPTPAGALAPTSIFSILSIKVDKVYTSCTPATSVMFVGTVATNSPASPYGNLSGAPAAVSIGLTNATPQAITNVVTLIAGTVIEYSAAGGGTVTFTAGSATPPGSGGGPTVVVAPTGATAYRVVDLDASASTGNAPLTFQWTVVAGAAYVGGDPTQPKATGYIQGGTGVYTFRVTVTDAKGKVTTKDVNIQFL